MLLDLHTTAKALRVEDYYLRHKKVLHMLSLCEAVDHLNYISEDRKRQKEQI